MYRAVNSSVLLNKESDSLLSSLLMSLLRRPSQRMLNLLKFVFKVYCIYSLEKGPVILLMMTVLLSLVMTKKSNVLVVQGDRANKCMCVRVFQ